MRVGSSRVHIYRGSYFLIDILFQQFNVHEVMVLRECEYTRSHHMKYLWFSVLSRSTREFDHTGVFQQLSTLSSANYN